MDRSMHTRHPAQQASANPQGPNWRAATEEAADVEEAFRDGFGLEGVAARDDLEEGDVSPGASVDRGRSARARRDRSRPSRPQRRPGGTRASIWWSPSVHRVRTPAPESVERDPPAGRTQPSGVAQHQERAAMARMCQGTVGSPNGTKINGGLDARPSPGPLGRVELSPALARRQPAFRILHGPSPQVGTNRRRLIQP